MKNQLNEKLQRQIAEKVDENVTLIKEILEDSVDLVKRELFFHGHNDIKIVCFYTDGLANTSEIATVSDTLLFKTPELIVNSHVGPTQKDIVKNIKVNLLTHPSSKAIEKMNDAVVGILSGDAVFFIDGSKEALIISSRGWDTRSVDEPASEQVVRGPRDGFTESIRTNTALVRRRIRDPLFRIDTMKIGTKSKTDINIAYLKGTVKENLVNEVKKRLKEIKIDAILESGYIEELIEDSPLSPFPTIQSTERPDKVAGAILEGRVAIFVDNTPFVLIVPTYFWEYLQASDDYYSRFYTGTFYRIIRYLAFVISLILPSMYVMLVSFHQEMIPTPLALTIASGREIIPYPVLLEALIMEVAFELMREAGLRMPKPIGQAVSIVGSLIIGQAAVQAGLVSPFMVIIVALTGIASFAIPSNSASFSVRLIRFPLLLASGTLGLLGFAAAFSILAIHALSIRSFGEPYLAPATPFKPSDQKDSMIRLPWWKMISQPQLAEGQEDRISEHNQIPQPPDDKQSKIYRQSENNLDGQSNEFENETKEKGKNHKHTFVKPKKLKGGKERE
ncbi:spore germination protein [Calidifontibacillus oryziterrae]|uniref:spore germination protein n=1 Tax=Calidifontibacillus oryziterrae TaxID=1191699 RepID=UPI0002FC8ACA|nr:spore germination protein [Calidifontibacillus oryziterrae]